MRQLYYTLQTLMRGKATVLIQLVSLTLGLLVGIVLFARIAFDLSYNSGYDNPDELCAIMVKFNVNGTPTNTGRGIHGPVAYALSEAFPREIESSSISYNNDRQSYFIGDKRIDAETVVADTAYFRTMGIPVLSGQANGLANPDMVFVSETFARKAFYDENPIGKVISYGANHPVTIQGTFKDVAENNSERPEVVISFATMHKYNWRFYGWYGGDGFRGYVRLKDKSDFDKVNNKVQEVIDRHMPLKPEDGYTVDYSIKPMQKLHVENEGTQRKIMINGILGIAMLLIAALNYVLISISSIARRAKAIGVHKCNGASGANVFTMFIWETLFIVGLSLLLVVILIFNARTLIEDITQVTLSGLFTWQTLWLPVLVVIAVTLIAALIPGKMFSGIPVSQIFRQYKDKKQAWKRVLLFVQFSGVAFIFGLLCVVLLLYRSVMNADQGYNPNGVATAYCEMGDNRDAMKSALRNLPMVQELSLSMSPMAYPLSGEFINDNAGRPLFSTRWNMIDKDFAPLMHLNILEGRNIQAPGEALVNEEFVRRRHWTDSPIGKKAGTYMEEVIVGVVKDFVNNNLYVERQPVMMNYMGDKWLDVVNVRLKEPFTENLHALNDKARELFPGKLVEFKSLTQYIHDQYDDVRRFRDSVAIAFISIILIALMGLLGYVNDEVQRRTKEIAIRKVNGATAGNVLSLLSKDVVWLSIPAILLGAGASFFIGNEWLAQFAGLRVELGVPLYLLVALGLFLFIEVVVVVKAWRVANEDPVRSIKSE